MSIADQKISLAIVVKICVFLGSLLGVWYHNKYEVESLNEKVKALQEINNKYSIEVIKTDVKYNRIHINKLEMAIDKKRNK